MKFIKELEHNVLSVFVQEKMIINLGKKHGVRVTLDVGQKVARVRIQGQSRMGYEAKSSVQDLIHKIRLDRMEEQEVIMLAKIVCIKICYLLSIPAGYITGISLVGSDEISERQKETKPNRK